MSNLVIWCLWFTTMMFVYPKDPVTIPSNTIVFFVLAAFFLAFYFDFLK